MFVLLPLVVLMEWLLLGRAWGEALRSGLFVILLVVAGHAAFLGWVDRDFRRSQHRDRENAPVPVGRERSHLEIRHRSRGTVLSSIPAATLNGTNLAGAQLQGASLFAAPLAGADLRGADLRGACLEYSDLTGADLRGARLGGATVRRARCQGADLRQTDLRAVVLAGADLAGVRYDATTRWAGLLRPGEALPARCWGPRHPRSSAGRCRY